MDNFPVIVSDFLSDYAPKYFLETYLIFSQSMPNLAILSVNVLRLMPR